MRASSSRFRLAAVLAVSAALSVGPATAALAAPGDSGDVKVHADTTPVSDQRDDPKVCAFYFDAFNFDTISEITFTVDQQPPTGGSQVLAGSLTLTNGAGHTGTFSLPDGHYKLNWTLVGGNGTTKHKTFMVACPSSSPSARPSKSPSGSPSGGTSGGTGQQPSGPVGAGGGGGSQGPDGTEIVAGATLLAVSGGLGLRAYRRRSRRAAA